MSTLISRLHEPNLRERGARGPSLLGAGGRNDGDGTGMAHLSSPGYECAHSPVKSRVAAHLPSLPLALSSDQISLRSQITANDMTLSQLLLAKLCRLFLG